MDQKDSGKVLEVVFDARVLRYGTVFELRVFDSGREEVQQLVNPGDAVEDLPGNDIAVRTALGRDLVAYAEAHPNPFTPNGDGVNDDVRISYSLLKLTDGAPVEVEIYDLSGVLVREVYAGTHASGRYTHVWDGRDDGGVLVPPGLYIYRVSVHADDERERRAGVLCVTY